MAQYVLVNRRAGKFTDDAKIASRASIASALAMTSAAAIVDDHAPADETARRVVILELNENDATTLKGRIGTDAMLEPLVRRSLHLKRPIELQAALPFQAAAAGAAPVAYQVTITGGGAPLGDIEVLFYVRDALGSLRTPSMRTDAKGVARLALSPGQIVSFVEPIPYAGFWITLAAAPPSGSTIDCPAIPAAPASGLGWWHTVMGAGAAGGPKGAGVRVGVIDTGCGPHENLTHVTLAGAFINGQSLPAASALDVAEHGTHTSGLIGARPSRAGDFAGFAPECDLLHVRVFASEDAGPSQADLIKAIDCLSRDNQCDLINMSLGGAPPSEAEEDCIRDALERGTLCICSSGNDAGPVNYPGAYPECVSVSALGLIGWAPAGTVSSGNRPHDAAKLGLRNLFLATFSSIGQDLDSTGPGVGVISTVPDHGGQGHLYMEMDGTSMASPAVCGALAATLSASPTYLAHERDASRSSAARQALEAHSQSIGLSVQYQGKGLPVI